MPPGEKIAATYVQAGVALSWEIDFWGRLRRLTEAARAQYLATEEGRRGALVSLVSQVMTTYFQLLEQDLELEIGRKTRDIANDNLRLVGLRHDRGAATGLDVSQAQQLLYTATSAMAAAERGVGQTEDALSLLLGGAPASEPRGKPLDQLPLPPQLPAGLPSALLERRPDIRQAEQNLVAANAQIGAARALYFPTIDLTGFFGAQSRALLQFFTAPARMEDIGPSALLPIFHAGQIRQQVRLTEAQQREMLAAYQKAVYSALRDVSDALIAHDRTREQREQQEQLVRALIGKRAPLDPSLPGRAGQLPPGTRRATQPLPRPASTLATPHAGIAVRGPTLPRPGRRMAVGAARTDWHEPRGGDTALPWNDLSACARGTADTQPANLSVAATRARLFGGSKALWPLSGVMMRSASGHARWSAHALSMGQTTS